MRARGSLLLVIAMLAGCSIVNAPSDHRAPLSFPELCQEFAELSCAGYLDCCPSPAAVTLEDCVVAAATRCVNDFGGLASNARTGYSADVASRIVHEGRVLSETCDLELADWANDREGFQAVLQGSIAGGERCDEPAAPTAENFAPLFSCATTDRACVLGGGVWTCASRRSQGESCVLSTDCQTGLHCTGLIGGTCEPRKANGSACVVNDTCESLACRGFVCVPRTLETVYCGMMGS